MKRRRLFDDLQGLSRLGVEATLGMTDLVEEMHRSATSLPRAGRPGRALPTRTRGITGFVYRSVRRVTRWVGIGIEGAFDRLRSAAVLEGGRNTGEATPQRDAALAALNGVCGDRLESAGNPLAISMQFRRDGRPIDPAQETGRRVVLLLHGLCCNDLHWRRNGHDHGAAIATDLDFAPIYLFYNSGRAIAANGKELAQRLEDLMSCWGAPVDELVVVAHSMGGLVMRSACAAAEGCRWPSLLRKIVFLGTPHLGAPLERGGNRLHRALGVSSYTAAFARLARVRSTGITDLRHGLPGNPHPAPAGVESYAVAATLSRAGEGAGRSTSRRLRSDGLVPVASAFGDASEPAVALAIPASRRHIGYGMNHMDLLDRPEIYARIRGWLAASRDSSAS
ncbi:MAG: alpha/beta hydrolase [Thermoanaerobaculia bacterium]